MDRQLFVQQLLLVSTFWCGLTDTEMRVSTVTSVTTESGCNRQTLHFLVAVGRDVSKILRITDKASIFTAELVALNLALDIWIKQTGLHSQRHVLMNSPYRTFTLLMMLSKISLTILFQ